MTDLIKSIGQAAKNDFHASEQVVKALQETLKDCGSTGYIQADFELLGEGSFKEVYSIPYTEDFVIKFSSMDNELREEKIIYNKALDAELGQFFARTAYFPLGFNLDAQQLQGGCDNCSLYLECEGSEGCTATLAFSEAILQERVIELANDRNYHYHVRARGTLRDTIEEYNLGLIEDGEEPLSAEAFALYLALGRVLDAYWVQMAINYHGLEATTRLVRFLSTHSIHDLHSSNIGFTPSGRPVIFDWLSSSCLL